MLKDHYSTLAPQFSFAVDAFKYIANRCKHLTTEFSNVTKSLDALVQKTSELDQKLERLGMCAGCNEHPKITKSFKGFVRYMLLDMPWYWCKCLWNSRYFRNWLRICIAALIGVLLGLLAFIAYDNAILRENQEKYILLQKNLRTNSDETRSVTNISKVMRTFSSPTELMISNITLISRF